MPARDLLRRVHFALFSFVAAEPTRRGAAKSMSSPAVKWCGFLGVLLCALGVQLSPVARYLDHQILDEQFRVLRALAPRAAPADVAVVGIDEGTFRAFPEPLALWHRHLAGLFEALAEAEPRVVGLDIVLPDRSYDFLEPGVDRVLLGGVLALRRSVPLVAAQTVDARGRLRPLFAPLASVLGSGALGMALLTADGDGRVRRFTPVLASGRDELPTLVGGMAAKLGLESAPGIINYAIGAPYTYVPMQEVLAWHRSGDERRLRAHFAGKAVLVGSVLPFVDRHPVPVALAAWEPRSREVPGVLIHAQILASMERGGLIGRAPAAAVLLLVALASLAWWLGARALRGGAVLLAGLGGYWAFSTWALAAGTFWPLAGVSIAGCLGLAARGGLEGTLAYYERRRLKHSFERYVSPAVMREILAGSIQPQMRGQRRRVCVLFSDIRGFTARSETQPPETIVTVLNRYFEEMAGAVHEHGGTVDKFIGDGLMAFFGAPKPLAEPGRVAFAAAQEMLGRLVDLNAGLAREGSERIDIGIGLHVGEVIVGHVGSRTRHEYTAIGDTVNVASRLEALTKSLGYPVVMTEEVARSLDPDAGWEALGSQPIKGHAPVAVCGWRPGERVMRPQTDAGEAG